MVYFRISDIGGAEPTFGIPSSSFHPGSPSLSCALSPSLSPPLPFPSIKSRPLKSSYKVRGIERCKLPQRSLGNWVLCILALKYDAVATKLNIFLRIKDQISCRISKFYAKFGNTWIVKNTELRLPLFASKQYSKQYRQYGFSILVHWIDLKFWWINRGLLID